ncbi:hypothetical protein Gasu2_11800 [Galdieria sulphuraria]|nr:hypothetical protein Gasu2_11800 [Galdieria sulphuraria]
MKRTRQVAESYSDDSSSDSDTLELRQALPVSEGDLGDLSLPPSTPEQYLRRVRQEARSLPDVVYWQEWCKQNVDSTVVASQSPREKTNCFPQEFEFLNNKDYLAHFKQVRDSIAMIESDSNMVELPEASDVKAWESLCWSYDGNRPELYSIDRLPLNELSCLDHLRCISLVRLFESWFRKDSFKSSESFKVEEELSRLAWLFGILAAIGPPLDGDTEASIRSILRHLIVRKRGYEISSRAIKTFIFAKIILKREHIRLSLHDIQKEPEAEVLLTLALEWDCFLPYRLLEPLGCTRRKPGCAIVVKPLNGEFVGILTRFLSNSMGAVVPAFTLDSVEVVFFVLLPSFALDQLLSHSQTWMAWLRIEIPSWVVSSPWSTL